MAYIGSYIGVKSNGTVFGTTATRGDHKVTLFLNIYYDAANGRVGFEPQVTYRRPTTSDILSPYAEGNQITIDGQTLTYTSQAMVFNEYATNGGTLLAQNTHYVYPAMASWDEHFKAWYDDSYGDGFAYKSSYTVTWNYGSHYSDTFTINLAEMLEQKYSEAATFDYPSLSDFADSEDPVMNIYISDKTLIQKLEFSLSFDGKNADFDFQELKYLNNYENSFTYQLTDEDRDTIRSRAYNTYRLPIYGIMRFTAANGTVYTKFTPVRYVNIQGEAPTLNLTAVDTNTTTVALTGNANYMIRYHSIAHIETNAVASAGATISSSTISWGGKTVVGESADILCETSTGQISCRVIDSRDNVVTANYRPVVRDYVHLTCILVDRTPPSADAGVMTFSVKGAFWNASFGAVKNTLDVQYRYKEYDADNYSAWISLPFGQVKPSSIQNDHNYTASGEISGLDYTKSYQLQVRAVDKLETATTQVTNVINTPIFDWSKDDFRINVPTEIQGWTYGSNVVLWESSSGSQMTSSHTAYLNYPLQSVPHGIVLVFSAADGDVSWNTHFVPKEIIYRNQGGAQTFLLASNAALGTFGAKYLHIYDDMIKGHTSNNQSGTAASNIKFDNSKFVLRAVLGV